MLDIDPSAGALAQVLGVRTLAMVVFLLVGGVVADRFSRIVVLQVSHCLTFLTQATAATLIISGDATLTQLTVIEGINGAVSAFTMPAMMGIVPLVVDRTRLQEANALLSFSRSGLTVIGPAIAGLLVVGVGPGWALAVNALTYAVAIVCLSRVGLPRVGVRPRTSALDGARAARGMDGVHPPRVALGRRARLRPAQRHPRGCHRRARAAHRHLDAMPSARRAGGSR